MSSHLLQTTDLERQINGSREKNTISLKKLQKEEFLLRTLPCFSFLSKNAPIQSALITICSDSNATNLLQFVQIYFWHLV